MCSGYPLPVSYLYTINWIYKLLFFAVLISLRFFFRFNVAPLIQKTFLGHVHGIASYYYTTASTVEHPVALYKKLALYIGNCIFSRFHRRLKKK